MTSNDLDTWRAMYDVIDSTELESDINFGQSTDPEARKEKNKGNISMNYID